MMIQKVSRFVKASALTLALSHSANVAGKVVEKTQFVTKPIEQTIVTQNNKMSVALNKTADYFDHVQLAQNNTSGVKRITNAAESEITNISTPAKLVAPVYDNTKLVGETSKAWLYKYTNYSDFATQDTTQFGSILAAFSKTNPKHHIDRIDYKKVILKKNGVAIGDSVRYLLLDGDDSFATIDKVKKYNKCTFTSKNELGVVLNQEYSMENGEIKNSKYSMTTAGSSEEIILDESKYRDAIKIMFEQYGPLFLLD